MKTSAPHSIFAWILDYWLIYNLLEIPAKLWPIDTNGWPQIALMALSALWVLVTTVLPGLYHAFWAQSVRFCSFGERVVGRVLTTDGKRWVNPYGTTRTYLYIGVSLALFLALFGSSPAALASHPLLDLLVLGVAAFSMILMGRGWSWGVLGVVAYRAWETAKVNPTTPLGYGWVLILLAVCVALALGYSVARRRLITA